MENKKIIISINPEHVRKIINGTKIFEYRKTIAKENIDSLIIYSTFPDKQILAEAEIIDTIKKTPKELWFLTKNESGINESFFYKYFKNKNLACAYKLGKITVYDKPKKLIDYGIKTAPQSYVYIKN